MLNLLYEVCRAIKVPSLQSAQHCTEFYQFWIQCGLLLSKQKLISMQNHPSLALYPLRHSEFLLASAALCHGNNASHSISCTDTTQKILIKPEIVLFVCTVHNFNSFCLPGPANIYTNWED